MAKQVWVDGVQYTVYDPARETVVPLPEREFHVGDKVHVTPGVHSGVEFDAYWWGVVSDIAPSRGLPPIYYVEFIRPHPNFHGGSKGLGTSGFFLGARSLELA